MPDELQEAHEDELFGSPVDDAAHEHDWQDTGFADVEDCPGCWALRSTTTGAILQVDL